MGCLLGALWGLHPYGEEVCLWDVYWEHSGGCTPMERRSACGTFIGSALGVHPYGEEVCLWDVYWERSGVHPYGEEVCLWDVYWERSGGAPLWRGGLSVGCLLGALWGLHPYGEEVCLWDVYWERSGGCTLMDRQGRRRGGQLPGSLHNGLGPP